MNPSKILIGLILFLIGCGMYTLVKYTPQNFNETEKAKHLIQKIAYIQPQTIFIDAAYSVEVTDNKILMRETEIESSIIHDQNSATPASKVVYFEDLIKIVIYKVKSGLYQVMLLDKTSKESNRPVLSIYTKTEEYAKQLCDAVYTMMESKKPSN